MEFVIKGADDVIMYNVSTSTIWIESWKAATAYFKLDPGDPMFTIMDGGEEILNNMPEKIDHGWYIIELKITFSKADNAEYAQLDLKSVFLYLSCSKLF